MSKELIRENPEILMSPPLGCMTRERCVALRTPRARLVDVGVAALSSAGVARGWDRETSASIRRDSVLGRAGVEPNIPPVFIRTNVRTGVT